MAYEYLNSSVKVEQFQTTAHWNTYHLSRHILILFFKMNSMRLLLLLTFIVYETQSTPIIKPLKFLKSLISKHLTTTTEQPLLEEQIYTGYNCESVEKGAIDNTNIEWNRQVFLVNEKPILIEVGNVGPIRNEYQSEDLAVNPEINLKVNYEENTDENCEEKPELSLEEEHKNVYEKDKNTQWLFGENTSEKLPEIDVSVGKTSIKDKIIKKINIIKAMLRNKNRLAIPIAESVEENINNAGITFVKPINTLELMTTGKPTNVQNIDTVQPITVAHQYTTTVQPSTSAQPVVSVQYSPTVKPESYMSEVQVNGDIESQEAIVTIPVQYRLPLQSEPIYYSDSQYSLWLNNCPPPLSHQICYRQDPYYAWSPILTNTFNANQFTLDNVPYYIPDHQNQKSNNDLTKVINYINIDATQPENPMKPYQDEQWARYAYDDSKPINENPISYYIPRTADPESQPDIAFSSPDGTHSTSTVQPIVVYSADASILKVEEVGQTQPEYNWDQLLEPATVNSNVEGSNSPLRGDIPFGEDLNPNTNYDQSEGDTLKETRNVGPYNNEKKLVSQKNYLKVPSQVSEQAETETAADKIEIPVVNETKTPITKIETPISEIEKPNTKIEKSVVKIEKPVVEIETPAVTSTEIPYLKSNNVNSGV